MGKKFLKKFGNWRLHFDGDKRLRLNEGKRAKKEKLQRICLILGADKIILPDED